VLKVADVLVASKVVLSGRSGWLVFHDEMRKGASEEECERRRECKSEKSEESEESEKEKEKKEEERESDEEKTRSLSPPLLLQVTHFLW